MSDAKTAAEIEDILSSIRRLVSQDRKAASAAPRPQILSRLVVEDRLILTPAQRITPVKRAPATVTPLKRPGVAVADWPETQASAPQAPIAEAAAQQNAAPQAILSPGKEAPLSPLPPGAAARPEALVSPAMPPQSAEPRPQMAKPAVQSAEPSRLHLTPSEPAAEGLAWEAEMGDAAPDLASLDWSSFTFARRPMAETYAARSRAAERLATPSPAPEPPAVGIKRAPPQEPQADPMDLTASLPEAEPAQPILQEEDSIFSEDVLRELVRDLIREQLQGDLGERITRNIRKLIKAEIARAIEVRALD